MAFAAARCAASPSLPRDHLAGGSAQGGGDVQAQPEVWSIPPDGGLAAAGDGSGQEQGMLQAVAEDRAQREDWGCAPGDEQPSAKGGGCGAPQALLMYARSKY